MCLEEIDNLNRNILDSKISLTIPEDFKDGVQIEINPYSIKAHDSLTESRVPKKSPKDGVTGGIGGTGS
jgi:hypothetical protein